jgi:hypothetical protein
MQKTVERFWQIAITPPPQNKRGSLAAIAEDEKEREIREK